MELDFRAAVAALGTDGAMRIANAARAPGDYLFATLLPERNMPGFEVKSGNMTVRATMAGLTAMDSPYAPGGFVELSNFLEQTAKLTIETGFSEQTLRQIKAFMEAIKLGGGDTSEAMVNEVLNFLQKLVIQPQLDVAEWLRGQALVFGEIDWTFNGKNLVVDYGVPAANFLTNRTGNDAYDGSTSKFWEDIRSLRRLVRGAGLKLIAHPDTIEMAQYNTANSMVTVNEGDGQITFRRTVNSGASFSADVGDIVTLIKYDKEAEVLNPADRASTVVLPFMERGKILAVGPSRQDSYVVGQGTASQDPNSSARLGYTHVAPTIEGGRPGRWAEVYVPEREPYRVQGRSVSNLLPVIEGVGQIAVASTNMP